MTTNTPSQAASIDAREFRLLIADLCEASDLGPDEYAKARAPFIAHIDAKLAQAFNDGAIEGRIHQRGLDDARIQAAESRLAEIQRGVEEIRLRQFGHYYDADEVNAILALIHFSGLSG